MAAAKLNRIQSGIAERRWDEVDWRNHSEAIFRAAQHGEDYRFEEEQSKAGCDSGNGQAAFAHLRRTTTKFSGISRAASATAVRPV